MAGKFSADSGNLRSILVWGGVNDGDDDPDTSSSRVRMWSRSNTQRSDPFCHRLLDTLGAHTLCDTDEGDGDVHGDDHGHGGDGGS